MDLYMFINKKLAEMPDSTDIGKVTKPPDKPNLLEHDCV